MTGKDRYHNYLASDAWKSLRNAARARASGACEMCGGPADHVHHVRYPKRFEDDHVDNLVVVCAYHHDLLHGKRPEMGQLATVDLPNEFGNGYIRLIEHDGRRYYSLEDVCYALCRDNPGYVGMGGFQQKVLPKLTRRGLIRHFDSEAAKHRRFQQEAFVPWGGVQVCVYEADNPKADKLQEFLEEVCEQVIETGRFDPAKDKREKAIKASDDPMVTMLDMMRQMADAGIDTRLQLNEVKGDVGELKEFKSRQEELNKELAGNISRISFEGWFKASQYIHNLPENPHNITPPELGMTASKLARQKGVKLKRLPDTFTKTGEVNGYPLEILDEAYGICVAERSGGLF